MEKIIAAASRSEVLSPSNVALLFGIYCVVITSMSVAKVQATFQDSKDCLLSRYRCGLERALGHAGLLNTQEMNTLQAFVLLIVCIRRDDDSRTVWTLVGLAIRLAIGMGLQHDGTKFKLNPLETELRRRLVSGYYNLSYHKHFIKFPLLSQSKAYLCESGANITPVVADIST